MALKLISCLFLLSSVVVDGSVQSDAESANSNPVRKVVTMLQMMQKKVEEEGKKETELYDKYMCWCKTGGGDLAASIAEAGTRAPQLQSSIEESEAQAAQLKEDLVQHNADRDAAKKAMAEATALRETEAKAFAAEKAEADANIGSINKAVTALEKGMGGAFLQTTSAQVLKHIVMTNQGLSSDDKQDVLAFLSGGSEYIPQAGQITGILKEMHDNMAKDLADATAAEQSSIQAFDGLMAAKKKEVLALTKMLEEKLQRQGELAVKITEMKNDLTDTEQALVADKKFLADLDKNCADKKTEWAERTKTRAEELVALAETIKVLNDDDALELFKKALPSASASFAQVAARSVSLRSRALNLLRDAQNTAGPKNHLNFIVLALDNKKIGFEKVIGMIDEMIKTLHTEQTDDDQKKDYCGKQLDSSDDQKKGLERDVADAETAISETHDNIASLKDAIASLEASIKALDTSVAEATEQRKQEHKEFNDLVTQDSAAIDVLNFAKNRLNKFYNPKLHKAAPKRQLSEEDRITVNMGGTLAPTAAPGGIAGTGIAALVEVGVHVQLQDAPAPPPETFGAYAKSGESTGVIQMISLLIADLDKELTESKTAEKDAQADYEKSMADSATKRAADSKTLAQKKAEKADAEATLQEHEDSKKSSSNELSATVKYIASLHSECDWLLQYFDVRQEARAGEIDSLGRAKAVLNGADFSFAQTGAASLRR